MSATGSVRTLRAVCRNIRTLHNFAPPATASEIHEAALQYVRKISGQQTPSRANEAAFETAVETIATATTLFLDQLVTSAPPRDRAVDAERRKARAAARFGKMAS
jgi:hypothetical protein